MNQLPKGELRFALPMDQEIGSYLATAELGFNPGEMKRIARRDAARAPRQVSAQTRVLGLRNDQVPQPLLRRRVSAQVL